MLYKRRFFHPVQHRYFKKLKCGDKVTIMSDKITYSITKNDAVRSAVICSGNLKMNYIKDDFTHIEFKIIKQPLEFQLAARVVL